MTDIIFIRGIPGTGKSTEAERLSSEHDRHLFEIIESDEFWLHPKSKEYDFDHAHLPHAHEFAQAKFRRALYHEIEWVFVANTLCQQWELDIYLTIINDYGGVKRVSIINMEKEFGSDHKLSEREIERFRGRYIPLLNTKILKYVKGENLHVS